MGCSFVVCFIVLAGICGVINADLLPPTSASLSSDYPYAYFPASYAIDNDLTTYAHSNNSSPNPWLIVKFQLGTVSQVVIHNRPGYEDRINPFYIFLSKTDLSNAVFTIPYLTAHPPSNALWWTYVNTTQSIYTIDVPNLGANNLKIIQNYEWLNINEVQVYGSPCADTTGYNCTGLQSQGYCTNPTYFTQMQQFCNYTCYQCSPPSTPPTAAPTLPPTPTCTDLNAQCPQMVAYCNTATYYTFMTQNCPATCNRCPAACQDQSTSCTQNAALCNNASYYTLMTQLCPATCNRCPSSTTTGSTTCADTLANCPTLVANGLCSSTFYTIEQKRQYCGRSCALC